MNTVHISRGEDISKVTLPSGVTLLSQRVPDALSVAVGVWVRCGSRDEDPARHGITHFLEHMVFKGTERRTARELALAMDRIGGQLDAFTTKELTCFTARVLPEYFDTALDVLSDMLVNPTLDDGLIATEKQVVWEEIRNVQDDPEDLIHEYASDEVFGEHPLARPILGTVDSVGGFDSAALRGFLAERYSAGNLVIAVAGPLDHEEVRRRAESWFTVRPGPAQVRVSLPVPPAIARARVETRDLQQQHLWFGRSALSSGHPDRYALLVLSTLLGGSMSSRLFQSIRERAGLAYSVFSFTDFASDAGLQGTYMAVSPGRVEEAIRLTLDQYVELIDRGCERSEIEDTKMQLKGNLLLAMESVGARMNRLARNELNEGRFIGLEELVARVDAVTPDDVLRLARTVLAPDRLTLVSVGPNPATGPF